MMKKLLEVAVNIASNKKLMMGVKLAGYSAILFTKGCDALRDLEDEIDTQRMVDRRIDKRLLKYGVIDYDDKLDRFAKSVNLKV